MKNTFVFSGLVGRFILCISFGLEGCLTNLHYGICQVQWHVYAPPFLCNVFFLNKFSFAVIIYCILPHMACRFPFVKFYKLWTESHDLTFSLYNQWGSLICIFQIMFVKVNMCQKNIPFQNLFVNNSHLFKFLLFCKPLLKFSYSQNIQLSAT